MWTPWDQPKVYSNYQDVLIFQVSLHHQRATLGPYITECVDYTVLSVHNNRFHCCESHARLSHVGS